MMQSIDIKGKLISIVIITILSSVFYNLVAHNSLIKEVYNEAIIYLLIILFSTLLTYFISKNFIDRIFQSSFTAKIVQGILTLDCKKIEKENAQIKKLWKHIVLKIESTHHTSLQNRIKDLDSYEEINFPMFKKINHKNPKDNKQNIYIHKFDFDALFLNKIKEFALFFEMLNEKYEHKSMYLEYINDDEAIFNAHKNFIKEKVVSLYKVKYLFKFLLEFKNFLVIFIPLVIVGSIYGFIEGTEKYYIVFFGTSCIILIYPLIRLIDTCIQIALLYMLKIHTSHIILLHGFYLIVLAFSFTLMGLYGLHSFFVFDMDNRVNVFGELFTVLQSLIFNVDFSNINIAVLFDIHNKDKSKEVYEFLIVIKLIILAIIIKFLIDTIDYFYEKFDQFYYEQKIKKYLLPPELLRMLSFFILGVTALGYIYLMFSSGNFSFEGNINNKSHTERQSTDEISNEIKVNQEEEDTTFEQLLPFSIFIALLSGILAISTRDIMDNYFAGLSMKVDPPYAVGNSIKINNYGMLIVIEIGIRCDIFYEIETNSHIHIPHKILTTSEIKNYTQPTLDYRAQIEINAKDLPIDNSSIPREAEKILLLSSFINTGVSLPEYPQLDNTVSNIDIDETKIERLNTVLNEYVDNISSIIDELNEMKNGNWEEDISFEWKSEIDVVWKAIDDLSHSYMRRFFLLEIIKVIRKSMENDRNIKYIYYIKKTIISIILSLKEFNDMKKNLNITYDDYGIRRKYDMFTKTTKDELNTLAENLVNISFYYFMLANRLWKLKDTQASDTQKNTIDNAMIELLNVPRVTSEHHNDGGSIYWKVKLLVTLELAEQSDETIHHINMYNNGLMHKFGLNKEGVNRLN